MATETAVTPERAHPFTAGEDFCLVHNGSLSNPYSVRRKLEPLGIKFETDNDTEAACRFWSGGCARATASPRRWKRASTCSTASIRF
jgi:glutamate synthase domain-containing protein 1